VSLPFEVIHQGTAEIGSDYRPEHGCVLVVGNAFPHKAMEQAVAELAGCAQLIVLGGEQPELRPSDDVQFLPSGDLSRAYIRELYEACSVVVYPSLYEGFGLPILDALAIGRPVIAMDTEISRELRRLTSDPNLHLVPTHSDLRDAVVRILSATPIDMGSRVYRTWKDVAADYANVLTSLLESPIDVQRVRRRWEVLTTISSVCPLF
jgi:glycosyltransferase involved in cell wall biosynthesis